MMISKRPLLIHPTDALFPFALMVSSLAGYVAGAARVYICSFVISAFALFSDRCLRLTFASQPSVKSVRGSVKCALLLQVISTTSIFVILSLYKGVFLKGIAPFLLAGFLINIEHIFYEYMYAMGERHSAELCEGLTALFTWAGLTLTGNEKDFYSPAWIAATSAVSALVAITVSLATCGMKGRLNARLFRAVPITALRTILYPAAFVLLILYDRKEIFPSFFAGLALYETCRTPFRRSRLENGVFFKIMLLICVVCAAIIAINMYNYANLYCCSIMLAALCAYLLYGNFYNDSSQVMR